MRAAPQFGRPGPSFAPQATTTTSSSSSRSLLNFLLPVYAIGIGLYMMYTLFKVFNKSKKGDGDGDRDDEEVDEEESDYDGEMKAVGAKKATTIRFRERNRDNFRWDADQAEFKYFNKSSGHYARGEETEDELNGYSRYETLDADYVAYLKSRRRKKRQENGKYVLATSLGSPLQAPSAASGSEPLTNEIPLTTDIGLTSITNTNVLMNETLERMKYSLNKINQQLNMLEKKNSPLDDPELEALRLQLTQTELQMGKIMTIVDDVSSTVQTHQMPQKSQSKSHAIESDEEKLSDPESVDDEENNDEKEEWSPLVANAAIKQQHIRQPAKTARLRKIASNTTRQQAETGHLRNRRPNINNNNIQNNANKREQHTLMHKQQQQQHRLRTSHKRTKKASDSSASSSPSLPSSPALSTSLSSDDASDQELEKQRAKENAFIDASAQAEADAPSSSSSN
jgi:hypothetical protein